MNCSSGLICYPERQVQNLTAQSIPHARPRLDWLRPIADLAVALIAITRCLEEIESLRAPLEVGNTYVREEVSRHRGGFGFVARVPIVIG